MSARVHDFTPDTKVLSQEGMPTLLCRWCVTLECGCSVWVGIRMDDREAALAGVPCCKGHTWILEEFNRLMALSLLAPTDRALVDVSSDLLQLAGSGSPRGAR